MLISIEIWQIYKGLVPVWRIKLIRINSLAHWSRISETTNRIENRRIRKTSNRITETSNRIADTSNHINWCDSTYRIKPRKRRIRFLRLMRSLKSSNQNARFSVGPREPGSSPNQGRIRMGIMLVFLVKFVKIPLKFFSF